jgi:hypothetical protein
MATEARPILHKSRWEGPVRSVSGSSELLTKRPMTTDEVRVWIRLISQLALLIVSVALLRYFVNRIRHNEVTLALVAAEIGTALVLLGSFVIATRLTGP